jgi:hypothetical protein
MKYKNTIKLRLPEIQLLAVVERIKDREIPKLPDGVVRKLGRLVLSRTSCYIGDGKTEDSELDCSNHSPNLDFVAAPRQSIIVCPEIH